MLDRVHRDLGHHQRHRVALFCRHGSDRGQDEPAGLRDRAGLGGERPGGFHGLTLRIAPGQLDQPADDGGRITELDVRDLPPEKGEQREA